MIPLPSLSDNIAPIREALDAASHDQQVNWMRGLGRKELRALYELAEGKGSVALSDLHGATDELANGRSHGINSQRVDVLDLYLESANRTKP